MIATVSAGSKEAIRIPVRAVGISTATLATYTVEVAVIATTAPAGGDWKTAAWTTSTEPDHPAAKLVIGPGSASGITLTADTTYTAWVRVTGDGQSPVVRSGAIKALT